MQSTMKPSSLEADGRTVDVGVDQLLRLYKASHGVGLDRENQDSKRLYFTVISHLSSLCICQMSPRQIVARLLIVGWSICCFKTFLHRINKKIKSPIFRAILGEADRRSLARHQHEHGASASRSVSYPVLVLPTRGGWQAEFIWVAGNKSRCFTGRPNVTAGRPI